MAAIQLTLSDLDLVGIGLIGEWEVVPTWLLEALTRAADREPRELVRACRQNAQLGLLEDALVRIGAWDHMDAEARDTVSAFNAGTVLLTATLDRGMEEIDYVLSRLDVPVAYLKGPVTSTRYYRERWHRWSKDIDLLVAPEHAVMVYAAMQQLGYAQGRYHAGQRDIATTDLPVDVVDDPRKYELPRQTKLARVELAGHAPVELLRRQSDRFHLVDEDSAAAVPIQIEVHYALEPDRRVPVRLEPASLASAPHGHSLDPESMLVYLAFKTYVDLVLLGARGGIKIMADLVRMVEHEHERIEWPGIIARYHDRGLCSALAYTLHHAVHLYGCGVDLATAGTCSCDDSATGPLDLGDLLPFLARGRRPFSLRLED